MNCKKCNVELHDQNTVKNKEMRTGFLNVCRPCNNEYKLQRLHLKPKKPKITHRKCARCAKEFIFNKCSNATLCSMECKTLDAIDSNNLKECNFCKKSFIFVSLKKKYCRDLCAFRFRMKKRIFAKVLICIFCKKKVLNKDNTMSSKSQLKGYVCSTICLIQSNIEKDKETDCWIWKGFITKDGSPRVVFKQKELMARRFSYDLYIGKLDKHELVITTSSQKLCVNPSHIRKVDNRSFLLRKYTDKEEEICSLFSNNKWSKKDISEKFNIPIPTIEYIIHRGKYPEIDNYDICINCSKQHDNLGSQFCSNDCTQQYLNT